MMHTLLIIVGPLICSMPMEVESHDSKPYHLLHKTMPCLNIRRYTARDVVFKVEECKSHVLIRTLSYFSKWKR